MKMVPSHLAPDKKSETVSVFPNISNNSSKDSWIKLYTSWCMSDQTHISWQVWAPWDGGLYVARGTFQRPSVKPAAQRQTTLVLCQNLWHLDKHNACYWSVNKGTTVMKKAGAVLLTWWKETGETSKRMSVFKDGTSDLTILCGWKLPDDKEENYIELLLSKSTQTHTHTKWDTHCLLSTDRGFLHHCSAMGARGTEWKRRASHPIHRHDTKERLEGWENVTYIEKMRTCRRLVIKRSDQISPVCSYLAHEISTVDSSSTPNTSPSQERKRPNSAALKNTETQITVNCISHRFFTVFYLQWQPWHSISLTTQCLTAQTYHDILLWHK